MIAGCCKRILAMWLLAAGMAACTGSTSGPSSDGVDAEGSDVDVVIVDVDVADTKADTVDVKDTPDTPDQFVEDEWFIDATDAGDTATACPGGAFCPCKIDSECDAGKCLETPEGLTCAPTCVEGCPGGYTCKPLGSIDPVNYCVYSHLSLCAPCSTNKDCQAQGVTDALCLDYGSSGHFCGGACSIDNDCGAGYTCADVPDPVGGGKTVKQCKAKNDVCACSAWAKTAGTTTSCSNGNSAGKCTGSRTCDASGLTACSAKTPAVETCNNQDDDCNGTPDDLPTDATCANSAWLATGSGTTCKTSADCAVAGESCDSGVCHTLIGTCVGKRVCIGGADVCQGAKMPKVEVCDGEDNNCDGATDEGFAWSDPISGTNLTIGSTCGTGACAGGKVICASFVAAACSTTQNATTESCNGTDDNCNGTVDEDTCSDNNPCTADLCDAATGTCQHLAVEAACDDGDPCTLADACSSTICVGTQAICDDGNPCTADTCDAKNGACLFANQTGSCSDGNACTSGDTCGTIPGGGWGCVVGKVIDCNDANPCTDDSCDGNSGCAYASNNVSLACYDGPDGTAGNGLCHGGLRYCQGGLLGATCQDQVVPATAELCNGLDDSCNGITDEGCAAATVTLSFAAAQTAGKSGTLSANVQLAPDRPAVTLQDPGVQQRMALGIFAWFVHLLTGN